MNSNTAATLQKLKNGNGDYIWRDRLVADSPDTLLGRPVQYLETMPDAAAGEAFPAVGDFKRGYFIVDHTTGVRTRPDNITEPGFYKVHTDKYRAVVWWTQCHQDSGACWFLIRRVRGFGPFLPSVESNNENN